MATKAAKLPKQPRKARPEPLPDTPDPIEIAMFAAASGKPLPEVARRILEEQAELIHAQRDEIRLRHVGEVVRAALWTILAILAFAVVVMLGTVVYRAARADALVVESFRVPPALAAQGLTGEVVATQVLDKIAEFQEQTESIRAADSYDNNWGEDLKIDIPQTGATLDQLWKLLRAWLGKETRISGEVIQAGDGLALTARVGGSPGERFTSESPDLDSLVTKAAEHILGRTQPYRYSVYLSRAGREAESVAVLRELTSDPSPAERKWAYTGLSASFRERGEIRASLAAAERALAIDPDMAPAMVNAGIDRQILGHDQRALELHQRVLEVEQPDEYDPAVFAANLCMERFSVGLLQPDPRAVGQALACLQTAPASYQAYIPEVRTSAAGLRHDWRAASAIRATPGILTGEEAAAITAFAQLLAQKERGASPTLAQALDAFMSAAAARESAGPWAKLYRAAASTQSWPYQAEVLAMLGRRDEAAALIARTPLDCYYCVRVRGMVAQAQGDLPTAQRWFAEAVRQGPRLAFAYVDWGRLLIRARRYDAAIAKLERAAELAPNWADPLKYWGDALVAQDKRQQALKKYDAALKQAPRWEELRRDRAKLLTTT